MRSEKKRPHSHYRIVALSHADWATLKAESCGFSSLTLGQEYQILTSVGCETLFFGEMFHVRRLERMELVEKTSEKLVFESRKPKRRSASIGGYSGGTVQESPSGKVTFFSSSFPKIAAFENDSNVADVILLLEQRGTAEVSN